MNQLEKIERNCTEADRRQEDRELNTTTSSFIRMDEDGMEEILT